MPTARHPHEVAKRIQSILEFNKVALFTAHPLVLVQGITPVMYGDQKRLPITPMVCVEAGELTKTLVTSGNTTLNEFRTYILVYHSEVQDIQTNKLESEQLGAAVADLLEDNLQLVKPDTLDDPLVIHGFVTNADPGYSFKDNTLYAAVRLTWQGKSKTRLGA